MQTKAETFPADYATAKRWTGIVRWYNSQRRYGFITRDETGEDVFLHAAKLRSPEITDHLQARARVSFRIVPGSPTPKAVDIQLISHADATPTSTQQPTTDVDSRQLKATNSSLSANEPGTLHQENSNLTQPPTPPSQSQLPYQPRFQTHYHSQHQSPITNSQLHPTYQDRSEAHHHSQQIQPSTTPFQPQEIPETTRGQQTLQPSHPTAPYQLQQSLPAFQPALFYTMEQENLSSGLN